MSRPFNPFSASDQYRRAQAERKAAGAKRKAGSNTGTKLITPPARFIPQAALAAGSAALERLGIPANLAAAPGIRLVAAFPWPPAALNPNARDKWARIRATNAYRTACFALTLEQCGAGWRQHFAEAAASGALLPMELHLFPPTSAERDDDNAEAMFKPGRDGMASALKVNDARFRVARSLHPADPALRHPEAGCAGLGNGPGGGLVLVRMVLPVDAAGDSGREPGQ